MWAGGQFMGGRNSRTKLDLGAMRLKGNVEIIGDLNGQCMHMIVRIIPQRKTICSYLIGIDEGVVKFGSIIKRFVENKNVCKPRDRIIIGCGA
jgi:hypothetical protein